MLRKILANCALYPLRVRGDERGSLIAIEGGRDVPFVIARVYYIFGTQPGVERGFHAHKALHQYAVCVNGSCVMIVDDGIERRELALNRPDEALHLGPMVWHEMREFSPDCVLMLVANDHYDEADYIRDYDAFLATVRAGEGG